MTRPRRAALAVALLLAGLLPAGCEEAFGPQRTGPVLASPAGSAGAGGEAAIRWDAATAPPCRPGEADSPACAVETFIACLDRREQALCDAVGRGDLDVAAMAQPGLVEHRVERVEQTGADSASVFVAQRMCPAGERACGDGVRFTLVYFTRRAGDRWTVEDWTDAEHADTVPAA